MCDISEMRNIFSSNLNSLLLNKLVYLKIQIQQKLNEDCSINGMTDKF